MIPYARQWISEEDIAAVAAVLRSDLLTQGPAVEAFEHALAHETGAAHAVAVSSGTAALHLVCAALDLGPGRVGVTTPITFAATANAFLYTGAGVRFADVDPVTGLLDPAALEDTLRRLAAEGAPPGVVIAVSLAGRAADLPALRAVCDRWGWTLVEDAAHSLGAACSGGCAHTRAAILSFHPVKHVCCGEGGAVLTNDAALAARIRSLRTHGIERPPAGALPPGEGGWFYEQVELGFHYRLTDLQAALGTSQLRRLPEFLARRRALARRYVDAFAEDVFRSVLAAPVFEEGHAWHLFVVHFRSAKLRLAAHEHLLAAGVRTQVHYIPVYRHPHHRRAAPHEPLPGAEAFYRGCLSLPLFPKLTDAEQDRVIEALRGFAASRGRPG